MLPFNREGKGSDQYLEGRLKWSSEMGKEILQPAAYSLSVQTDFLEFECSAFFGSVPTADSSYDVGVPVGYL